jgi:hypothetical protein
MSSFWVPSVEVRISLATSSIQAGPLPSAPCKIGRRRLLKFRNIRLPVILVLAVRATLRDQQQSGRDRSGSPPGFLAYELLYCHGRSLATARTQGHQRPALKLITRSYGGTSTG